MAEKKSRCRPIRKNSSKIDRTVFVVLLASGSFEKIEMHKAQNFQCSLKI
jgi:hypothetical protein